MIGLLKRDKRGKILETRSEYEPDEATKMRIAQVQSDFQTGQEIMTRSFREFNDRSVLTYLDDCQKAFNNYIPPRSLDPDESWRAQTVRPVTRNKIISIVAHVTGSIMYPNVFAQNTDDDEDKEAATVLKDCIEWLIHNSDYQKKYIMAMVAAAVAPAVIMKAEYANVYRKIKQMAVDGTWSEEKMRDELFSGFQANVIPVNELYIGNVFEQDIQRQPFLIENRIISYTTARGIYGEHPNFKYVKPGIQAMYVPEEGTFYERQDQVLQKNGVSLTIYHNRSEDLCLTFLNGVMVCSPDYPNPRMDKLYPFVKAGYEPINDGRFFYYKSAVDKMAPDQDVVDQLYNMVLDGTFMSLMPPMALFGSEEMNASVMVPGSVSTFRADTKMQPITTQGDLRSGMAALDRVEQSLNESSNDPLRQGILPQGGERTAFEVAKADQNAQRVLGLFGKQVKFFVEDIGMLMIGDILQHFTVADLSNISSPADRLKFKTFVLPNKIESGKKVTKKIVFDSEMFDEEGETPEGMMEKSFDLMEQEGGYYSDKRLVVVNPEIIRQMKYRVFVSADDMLPKNAAIEKALNLEAYDRAIQNPLANQETVFRDFLLENFKPGETDKYINKPQQQGGLPSDTLGMKPAGGRVAGVTQKGVDTNLLSQITGGNSLANSGDTGVASTMAQETSPLNQGSAYQ